MDRRDFLGTFGLLALLPGCAAITTAAQGSAGGASGAGRAGSDEHPGEAALAEAALGEAAFYDARTGERLSRRRLLRRMVPAPIVLLGEVHDNTSHHCIRGSLLLDWVRSMPTRPAAIIFEHLDREYNEALRLAQRQPVEAGSAQARMMALLDAARFDRQAWGWPAHLPLFKAALASGATWIAANFSRQSAQQLSRQADAAVDPTLTAVVESARWSGQAQQALEQALLQGHCNAISADVVARLAFIQRLRDAALALPLLDANERRSLLLAGNGHVRRDYGVPLYLGAYESEALVVGFEEVATPASHRSLADLVGTSRARDLGGAYDCVCLTTTVRSGDPCASMKAGPAGGAALNPAGPTQTPSR